MHMDDARSRRPFRQRRLPGFDYANPDHAFLVTVRARFGTRPFTNERLAREVVASLYWLRAPARLHLYAYCLMPDHLHLLLRPGTVPEPLGLLLGRMKSFITRQSRWLGYTGTRWQPRCYDHVVRKRGDGGHIVAYSLASPVRKGPVMEANAFPAYRSGQAARSAMTRVQGCRCR